MTLETAKRIKEEGAVPGQEAKNYDQYMLLNKEAEAILRGGMTICESMEDGSRKYTWIKVKPTPTDDESSIQQALKNYQKRKIGTIKKPQKQETNPQPSKPQPIATEKEPPMKAPKIKDITTLSQLTTYLKAKFERFVEIMDKIVDE